MTRSPSLGAALLLAAWLAGNLLLFGRGGCDRLREDRELAAREPELARRGAEAWGAGAGAALRALEPALAALARQRPSRVLMPAGPGSNLLTSRAFHVLFPAQVVIVPPETTRHLARAMREHGAQAALAPDARGRWRTVLAEEQQR